MKQLKYLFVISSHMENFSITQESIKIAVDYYSDDDANKLHKYSSKDEIETVISRRNIEIPKEEFLTYFLLYLKGSGVPEYGNYKAVEEYISDAYSQMRHLIIFNGQSLSAAPQLTDAHTSLPEHIGEAVGLSVISRIHSFNEADWCPIKKMKGADALKTFDFQIASTGSKIIQVENKGSIVDDNTKKSDPIYAHKASIKEKKDALEKLSKESKDPNPANLRYGTIAAVDRRPESIIKSWLTDPPPELILIDPKLLRLFIRLRFLSGWITFFSPRSQFATALATRINCLEKIQNPFELDNSPLKKVNGDEFNFPPFLFLDREFSFFSNKSHVTDGPAGGIILKISEKELFFLGMQEDLISLASQQNFIDIMNFDFPYGTVEKTIECNISRSRFSDMNLILPDSIQLKRKKDYIKLNLKGEIHYSSSGLVFGILPIS